MASPSPPPFSQDENSYSGLLSDTVLKVLIDIMSCGAAVILALTFFIVATRFRLWLSNTFWEKSLQWMDRIVAYLINNTITLVLAVSFRNDLYLVWMVLLLIAYNGISSFSICSFKKTLSERIKQEYAPVSNIVIIGLFVAFYSRDSMFWHALIALWSLVLLKSVLRILSFRDAEEEYGMKNTDLIANYMTNDHDEHESSSVFDPKSMEGYKYIVLGERKMKGETTVPGYVKKYKPSDEVVTVEKIYACKGVLSSCDKDFWLRDVCLSFALFKLLKRRFFLYHAAESNLPKTRALVFRGLLPKDREMERTLRVVRTELEFLRDLFYTKYPIIFGRGFPIFSSLLFSGIIGVSLWIATLAFCYQHTFFPRESEHITVNNRNVDLYLTYGLVLIIMMMEICEVWLYVFSDWSRVILICRYVNSQSNQFFAILITLLSFVSGPKFSKPLGDTLGQYSFLKNYNKLSFGRRAANLLDRSTCGFSPTETGKGFHKDGAIKCPKEVKKVIFFSLQATGEQLTNGELSLERNKMTHLSLVCRLRPDMQTMSPMDGIFRISRMYIIMVWHIATDLCDIHQRTQEPNKEKETASNRKAAVSLSRYCAYLALFVPELLLPSRCNSEKYVLENMVVETRNFFEKAKTPKERLDKMWKANDGGEKIIEKGAELGRRLMSPDVLDGQRWKVLAEFWAELILFLAPSGIASVHAEKLAEGGEFITQLWALLYHAGITEQDQDPYANGDSSSII